MFIIYTMKTASHNHNKEVKEYHSRRAEELIRSRGKRALDSINTLGYGQTLIPLGQELYHQGYLKNEPIVGDSSTTGQIIEAYWKRERDNPLRRMLNTLKGAVKAYEVGESAGALGDPIWPAAALGGGVYISKEKDVPTRRNFLKVAGRTAGGLYILTNVACGGDSGGMQNPMMPTPTGTGSGTVLDSYNAPVSGATVEYLTGDERQVIARGVANPAGVYVTDPAERLNEATRAKIYSNGVLTSVRNITRTLNPMLPNNGIDFIIPKNGSNMQGHYDAVNRNMVFRNGKVGLKKASRTLNIILDERTLVQGHSPLPELMAAMREEFDSVNIFGQSYNLTSSGNPPSPGNGNIIVNLNGGSFISPDFVGNELDGGLWALPDFVNEGGRKNFRAEFAAGTLFYGVSNGFGPSIANEPSTGRIAIPLDELVAKAAQIETLGTRTNGEVGSWEPVA
jgi:hypothetical protein